MSETNEPEFETYVIEVPPETVSPAIDDIDALLASYNKPSTEVPPNDTVESEPTPSAQPDTALGGQTGDWRGDPRYYQSGRKIGQLRSVRKVGVSSQPVPDTAVNGGDILDGEMLVMLIDTVIPMLIGIAHNSFSPYKIDVDKMSLTPKQERNLAKLCEKCANKIILKGDPLWVLVLVCLAIYGGQYYAIRQEAKQDFELQRKKSYEEKINKERDSN